MSSPKRTALIVADDALAGLVKAFAKAGYDGAYRAVQTTTEAKQYLRGEGQFADRTTYHLPCLVILSDGKGWEIVEWLRKEPEFMTTYAMVLGTSRDLASETRARDLGVAFESRPQTPAEYDALAARIGEFWLLG